MNYKDLLKYKLEKLIDIMLTDGVRPSDLVGNIFNPIYQTIIFYKNDFIVGEVNFYDNGDYDTLIKMKYIYELGGQLLRIEEEIEDKTSILWDRDYRENELLECIIEYMNRIYSKSEVESFINGLPEKLSLKIRDRIGRSA